jgi:hypothetical protein
MICIKNQKILVRNKSKKKSEIISANFLEIISEKNEKIFQKKKRNQSGKNSEVRIQKSKAEPLRD